MVDWSFCGIASHFQLSCKNDALSKCNTYLQCAHHHTNITILLFLILKCEIARVKHIGLVRAFAPSWRQRHSVNFIFQINCVISIKANEFHRILEMPFLAAIISEWESARFRLSFISTFQRLFGSPKNTVKRNPNNYMECLQHVVTLELECMFRRKNSSQMITKLRKVV